MKKYEDFEGMVISLLHPRRFSIRTWFCNCPQYLCLFHIVFECSPSIHDPGKMLVLPNQLLYWVLSTSDQDSDSFQPISCHPHTQIRIILFHDVERDIPNLEFSPSHASIGFSQIAFPIGHGNVRSLTKAPWEPHVDTPEISALPSKQLAVWDSPKTVFGLSWLVSVRK